MFNRLKGAIDSLDQRFQEEQARARAAQGSPARSSSTARRPAQASRTGSTAARDGTAKGPDPTEFDGELGDDSETSRTGTPGPAKQSEGQSNGTEDGENKATELPRDVQQKLQKLGKLEYRYQELLRSYRIAHARVTAIEPFEAALRENTPLTSIADPTAFTEYLNQLNLKGDMVLDELKRVSGQKNESEKKLKEAENDARRAWDEVAQLKAKHSETGEEKQAQDTENVKEETKVEEKSSPESADDTQSGDAETSKAALDASKSPPLTSRIKIPNFFSPKQKAVEPTSGPESSEDLFSYDSELPRLESELKEKQEEVGNLRGEVKALKKDIASARDTAESMSKSLEQTTKELTSLKETHRDSESQVARLMSELEAADTKLRRHEHEQSSHVEITGALDKARNELEELRKSNADQSEKLKSLETLQVDFDKATAELSAKESQGGKQNATSKNLISELKSQLDKANDDVKVLKVSKVEYEKKLESMQAELRKAEALQAPPVSEDQEGAEGEDGVIEKPISGEAEKSAGAKKTKKKKKKGGKATASAEDAPANGEISNTTIVKSSEQPGDSNIAGRLEKALAELKEKEAAIVRLSANIKDQDGLREEIDSLRDDLITVGQEHVEAKEHIKKLEAEAVSLNTTIEGLRKDLVEAKRNASTSMETEKAHKDLTAQFEDLKVKSKSLETDLQVAQQLASSRFKDLSELRDKMQKAQPEIRSLKAENEDLKNVRDELQEKTSSFDKLQAKHDTLQGEITTLKKNVTEKSKEISNLSSKLGTETDSKQKLESESRRLRGDLSSAQSEAKNAAQSLERVSGELSEARKKIRQHDARIRELESKLNDVERSESGLKEELELKSAQYASAESLMNSMRDQTSEMATQLREARERCDGLDEEVADAHRLLNERTREGETMRRLLSEVENRTESRLREMRDRMDSAIEERERIEDEASTSSRRRAREVEDARNKLREVERDLRDAQDAKEELETAQRDWKRRREELEQATERSKAEGEEAKAAMNRLRDALDESEKQARELDKQKSELRRTFEESKSQLEKLEKRNKALTDELKLISSRPKPSIASPGSSSPAGSRVMSPAPSSASERAPISQSDYLKNILLQFLEMKEKKHQVQFVPTLATLLQLDNKDQQKWTAAIMAR